MDQVVEFDGWCVWRHHKRILRQSFCGRWPHQLLAKGERVHSFKGVNPRSPPTTLDSSLHHGKRKENLKPLVQVLGGQLKKKALHTIEFTPEMRALAYIMIFNLYPVTNLMNLWSPKTVFLYDLFTHKEIDICGHIYHLFIKSIMKRSARLTLPFPSLVMFLISRAKVKIPSGLLVMQKEEPISEQTII